MQNKYVAGWPGYTAMRGPTRAHRGQEKARAAKRGLWADLQPVPPWEWRERQQR